MSGWKWTVGVVETVVVTVRVVGVAIMVEVVGLVAVEVEVVMEERDEIFLQLHGPCGNQKIQGMWRAPPNEGMRSPCVLYQLRDR